MLLTYTFCLNYRVKRARKFSKKLDIHNDLVPKKRNTKCVMALPGRYQCLLDYARLIALTRADLSNCLKLHNWRASKLCPYPLNFPTKEKDRRRRRRSNMSMSFFPYYIYIYIFLRRKGWSYGVRRRLGHFLDDATQQGVVGHVVLVPQGPLRRQDAYIHLLPKIASLDWLRPQVPHPTVVKGRHDGCPRLGEDLDRVPAHRVEVVVVLPLVRGPPPRLDPVQIFRGSHGIGIGIDYLITENETGFLYGVLTLRRRKSTH